MNTAVYTLRAFQLGLSLDDLEQLSEGDVIDMIIESSNDYYDYPTKATPDDIDKMFR